MSGLHQVREVLDGIMHNYVDLGYWASVLGRGGPVPIRSSQRVSMQVLEVLDGIMRTCGQV